jgi:ABC-type oligopeptide transport system ATPase subunit
VRTDSPLLEAHNLYKSFAVSGGAWEGSGHRAQAVDGVGFKIFRGETFGVVG